MRYAVILLRSWARKLGILRVVNLIRFRSPISQEVDKYEERFARALRSSIRDGDHIWDIGANRGLYTGHCLTWLGSQGSVVAFEPTPVCFNHLTEKFQDDDRLILEQMAIGEEEGILHMRIADDPLAGTHQISDIAPSSDNGPSENNIIEVQVTSCDAYWKKSGRTPNVIKIDVEGYESHVINGMTELMKSPDVRTIFFEIHFGLLEKAGDRMAPVRIEKLLRSNGFQTTWIDASHLQATRES
jgi:FkbM family methyltransferase